MKFEEEYVLRDYEVDTNDRIKPNYLSYYTQETAERCITHEKHGTRYMHEEEHRAYIISRIFLEVYGPVQRFSTVKLRTWISEGHGAIIPRHYELIDSDGNIVSGGSADWAVVDTDSKRIVRYGDYYMGNTASDEPYRLSAPMKFRIPNDADFTLSYSFRVGFSMTDINCHMNNVSYINPMYDGIPDVENIVLTSMNIHFKHEIIMGEVIDVYVSRLYTADNDAEIIDRTDPRADFVYFVRLIKDSEIRSESAWGFTGKVIK